MTRINTNVASLRGLRSLNRANQALDTSLARLSTGLQINSGKDNPSGLIAGETLRAQITTIEQSISNSTRANNVISTADAALGEVSGLLNQIRGLVQEGLNDGALSQNEIEANQLQIDAALSAINRISANTTFAGDKLIDGSQAFRTEQTAGDAAELNDLQINSAVFAGTSGQVLIDAEVTTAATQGSLTYDFVSGGLASDTTLEIGGSQGTDVVFLGAGSSLDNIVSAISALSDVTGVEVSKTDAVAASGSVASTGSTNDLTLADIRVGSGDQGSFTQDIQVTYADPGTSNAALSVSYDDTGADIVITVNLATGGAGSITSTAAEVASAINADASASAVVSVAAEGAGTGVVEAGASGTTSGGADGFLTIQSSDFGSDEFVDINVLQGTFATTLDGSTAATRSEGTDIEAIINGQSAQGRGLRASITTLQVDAALTFEATANTAGTTTAVTVVGGGSLFQIGQEVNAAGQISIGIEAVNTARLGGVSGKLFELSTSGGKSLLDVSSSNPGSGLVSIIDEAINRVTSLRGRLGALQKNVIETNISTLGVALENITEARSQIVDTDFAQETANLTRSQILSQSGLSTLAIANQNPSQVLSLLG